MLACSRRRWPWQTPDGSLLRWWWLWRWHDGSADSEEEDGDWWWLTLTDGWWAISSAPPSPFTESSSSGSFIGELSSRAPVLLTWMPSVDTECMLRRCQYPSAATSSLVTYFNTDAGVYQENVTARNINLLRQFLTLGFKNRQLVRNTPPTYTRWRWHVIRGGWPFHPLNIRCQVKKHPACHFQSVTLPHGNFSVSLGKSDPVESRNALPLPPC